MHIVESYGGGAFTSVNQLVNSFADSNEVILVHSLRNETPPQYWTRVNPNVTRIYLPMPSGISVKLLFPAIKNLVGLIKLHKPDVVHIHSSFAGVIGRIAVVLAGFPRKQVYYSPRGFSFIRSDISAKAAFVYKAIEWLMAKLGGTVVGCSSDEFKMARKLTSRATLIHNSIDVAKVDAILGETPLVSHDYFTVGTIGRTTAAKNPLKWAEVAKAVKAVRPNVRFLWIGDSGEDILKPYADFIDFVAWAPREDGLRLLKQNADIMLLTSDWEGLPLSLIEAMAMGLPCVATDIIGNRDVVQSGYNGFLASDVAELAKSIVVLADNPELCRKLGANARTTALAKFDLPRMVASYSELYSTGKVVPCLD